MKKTIFTGSGVAVVTPFHQDGGIHYEKLGWLIDYQIDSGTDAIVICGTTGEASTMPDNEHIEAIRYAVRKVAGRVPVIAGTGSNDTMHSLELSKEAKIAGADALLQVTPYYNKTTQSGLIQHFTYLADRVDLPVMLYNVPSRTNLNITADTYKRLSEHPNIVAAKEANGNINHIAQVAALCGDRLDIYSGNDSDIVPVLSLGGKGVVSVAGNILPREIHDICALFFDGKIKESAALQLQLMELIDALFIEVNPIPVKTAMNLMGFDMGILRMPLCEMSDGPLQILKAALHRRGLI